MDREIDEGYYGVLELVWCGNKTGIMNDDAVVAVVVVVLLLLIGYLWRVERYRRRAEWDLGTQTQKRVYGLTGLWYSGAQCECIGEKVELRMETEVEGGGEEWSGGEKCRIRTNKVSE